MFVAVFCLPSEDICAGDGPSNCVYITRFGAVQALG
jgi:hypothetical protein